MATLWFILLVNVQLISGCSIGKYGPGCSRYCSSRQCLVYQSICDPVTGLCPGGCKPGYTETDCSELTECGSGTYGPDCNMSCAERKCASTSSSCYHVTGYCDSGCHPGWSDIDCTRLCPSGNFGLDCSSICGNCTEDDICDHETGNCPGDCKPGWRGRQCKQKLLLDNKPPGSTTATSYVTGVVTGFVVAVTMVGGLILCLIRNRRLQCRTGSRSDDTQQSAEMTEASRQQGEDQNSNAVEVCNNVYNVLDPATTTETNDYDAITVTHYENV